jgi:hypothetical protein
MINLNKNIDHWFLHYFDYSMIIGTFLGALYLIVILCKVNIDVPTSIGLILFILVLSVLPGYFLVPSYIYPDYTAGKIFCTKWYINIIFVFFTLGIGPAVLYTIRWRKVIVKEMELEMAVK